MIYMSGSFEKKKQLGKWQANSEIMIPITTRANDLDNSRQYYT